jgi:hypothetical protein
VGRKWRRLSKVFEHLPSHRKGLRASAQGSMIMTPLRLDLLVSMDNLPLTAQVQEFWYSLLYYTNLESPPSNLLPALSALSLHPLEWLKLLNGLRLRPSSNSSPRNCSQISLCQGNCGTPLQDKLGDCPDMEQASSLPIELVSPPQRIPI